MKHNPCFQAISVMCAVMCAATLLSSCKSKNKLPSESDSSMTSSGTGWSTSNGTQFSQDLTDTSDLSATDGVITMSTDASGNVIPSSQSGNNSGSNTNTNTNINSQVSSNTAGNTTSNTTSGSDNPLAFNDSVRRICGTFIQPWLVEGWSQARWEQECQRMTEAGMKYIILQSITDFTYNTDQDLGQDPDKYSINSRLCLYPSSLPELQGVNNGVDSLKNCLEACRKYGMQAIIGPVSDNRWWKYGWGMPKCPSGKTNVVHDSYMTKWVKENAETSNRVADEVISLYGSQYGDQIFAWYYNNEIWNIDIACAGSDKGVYAQILGESMNLVLRHYTSLTPGKPMLLSSFINPSLSTPSQCGKMWQNIFKYTEFRTGDIFSPQDSYGNNTTQDLEAWTKAYYDAVQTKSGLLFWSNNENFRTGGTVATIDSFVYQINTTAKYCSANICFSWNHYFAPTEQNSGYNNAYLQYIRTGKLDTTAPSKPEVTVTGRKIVVDSTDSNGICGIRIYKGSSLDKTVLCRKDDNEKLFKTITLTTAGSYSVETYDFFGNVSARTSFTVA